MSAPLLNGASTADLNLLTHASESQEPDFDGKAALALARDILEPITSSEPDQYPIEALGPLAAACRCISEQGQIRPAMVGQSLLGAASLLTQGLFNVRTMAGIKPLSLYLLTLGDSGDGKSTAEDVALKPITERQRSEGAAYRKALATAEAARGGKKESEGGALVAPYRLCRDATVEGLRRELMDGLISQGVFTSEAASLLSGYGMSADHRAKTAAVFCGLWDNGLLSVSRAVGGRSERHGCRVAMHWLVQPIAAQATLGDRMLAEQGYWPRFLLAWPEPSQPRFARQLRWEALPAVLEYWERCEKLLSVRLPEDAYDCPTIYADQDATALIERAFESFEQQAKSRNGLLRAVKPFAVRGTEQLYRIAAVLAAFDDRTIIDLETAKCALQLTHYSIKTWLRVIEQGAEVQSTQHATTLYEWLLHRPGRNATPREVLRQGPRAVRNAEARDEALETLLSHNLVVTDGAWIRAIYPSVG